MRTDHAICDDAMPPPDESGPFGRAWRVDTRAIGAALRLDPELDTQLAGWIIEAPWAHPVWHSYSLSLIHLRQTSGLPAAKIFRPGATHEFLLFALDPTFPRPPQLDRAGARWLHPANFAAQLVELDDDAAVATLRGIVTSIVTGALNPDSDARRHWITLFGDHMIKAAFA